METQKGQVTKIKLLQLAQRPLVYFRLGELNCLIAKHSLNFLADVAEGMSLVIGGHFNQRQQFIVEKYSVVGKTQIMLEIELLQRSFH